jgi:hypothetical protein
MKWFVWWVLVVACKDDLGERAKISVKTHEHVEGSFSSTKHEVTLSSLVANGHDWRLETDHGPVHVWIPRGYDVKRAETIVYIHGYYIHVDDAWTQYELPQKFAASGINAMFIAIEAPSTFAEPIAWESMLPLLDTVEKAIGQPWPKRRVVAFGHSAAWRTLLGWLDEAQLDTVVLLDAAYGEIDQYKKWIDASPRHRLIDVGDDTREWTDQLHAQLPDSVVLESFPTVEDGIPPSAAKARILYIKSNLGHFPLVTNKTAIPLILRTLRARRVLDEPLAEILATP